MAESYREMEARHEALDAQMDRQEWADRWGGPSEYYEVDESEPGVVRDCTNCRNGDGCTPPNCTLAHIELVLVGGEIVCSGGAWDPREEVVLEAVREK